MLALICVHLTAPTAPPAPAAAPSLRLSADAVEWHPPSFITASAETFINQTQPEEPEPISVGTATTKVDAFQDKQPESSDVAAQPSTNSITPQASPRECFEVENEKDKGKEEEDASTVSFRGVVPDDSAAVSDDSVVEAAVPPVASSVEAITVVEEGGAPPPLEEVVAVATDATAMTGSLVEESIRRGECPAKPTGPVVVPDATLAKSEDCVTEGAEAAAASEAAGEAPVVPVLAPAPPAVAPAIPAASAPAAPAEAVAAVEAPGILGDVGDATTKKTGLSGSRTGGGADEARDPVGEDSTDAASDPMDDDDDALDNYLSSGGGGKGNADGKFCRNNGDGNEGGGFFSTKWRWGGVVALTAAVLLIGLRRR